MAQCKSTAEEVLFEWSHYRISSTDSKVRTTLHVSIIDSGNERVETYRIWASWNTTRQTRCRQGTQRLFSVNICSKKQMLPRNFDSSRKAKNF